jgi:Flp pilus assembly protein TadD
MATKAKKKTATSGKARSKSTGSSAARRRKDSGGPTGQQDYEAALKEFGAAVELLHQGKFAEALESFRTIQTGNPGEPELTDRARSYATICTRRLAPAPDAPTTADDFYYLGILQFNEGLFDEAGDTLTRALDLAPDSAKALYARAAVRAREGKVDACVADLRSAVAGEPTLRFQAVNDPDFDGIRDEAAFIDVVEPTPAEV